MDRKGSNALIVTGLALFMTVLDNLVVTTALPSIRRDLGATVDDLQWFVNAYTLTFAVLLLTGAALGDRFGRRRVFRLGLGLFTAASAAAALAPTADALIAARAVQGVGGAIVTPLTLTLLAGAFTEGKRGMAFGIWSGIAGVAVATGPLVGGAVVDGISWHWIFWFNVPVGIITILLAGRLLDESYGPGVRLDLVGATLATAGLAGLVWGIVRGNDLGWTSDQVLGDARRRRDRAGGVRAVGVAHARADAAAPAVPVARLHGHEPRVAGDVLRHVRLDLPARAVPADGAGLLGVRGRGADAAVDDHADVRRAGGRGAVRPDRRAAADGGRARLCRRSRWHGLRRSPASDVAYSRIVLPFILAGTGMALVFAPVANVVMGAVRREEQGLASATNNMIREIGGVLGIAVLVAIFSADGGYTSGQAYVNGLVPAVYTGAVVLALGALAALRVPRVAPTT